MTVSTWAGDSGALRLAAASYTYPGTTRPVLDGVDLEVRRGQVIGVVGPNEAGKSTLCLVAAGMAPGLVGGRLEGSVTIDGVETRTLPAHELAQRCGLLFQNPATQLSGTTVTVYEEVAFGPRNLGLGVPEIVGRVEEALGVLGIASLGARDPARLSGGQAQLVALASVLALRPAYLILDEPTSQLDPQGTELVGGALAALAARTGTGIVIVEHKTDLLEAVADRVAVLDGGRIVLAGTPGDVFGSSELADHGVQPPSGVRLRGALGAAGLAIDEAVLERARSIGGGPPAELGLESAGTLG